MNDSILITLLAIAGAGTAVIHHRQDLTSLDGETLCVDGMPVSFRMLQLSRPYIGDIEIDKPITLDSARLASYRAEIESLLTKMEPHLTDSASSSQVAALRTLIA